MVVLSMRMAFVRCFFIASLVTLTQARFFQREAVQETGELCESQVPCGWQIYNPMSRTPVYTLRNDCQCPPWTKCLRVDDDIQQEAFVYKCRRLAELPE